MPKWNNNLLQIYDSGALKPIWGSKLFEPSSKAYRIIAAEDTKALRIGLDNLLAEGATFSRVVFETHGHSGDIMFGDEKLAFYDLPASNHWRRAGYEQLFPFQTKMIFAGCNVAEGKLGWRFLEGAGELFLRTGGGYTLGWTSVGAHLLSHDIHFWGDWRRVNILNGRAYNRRSSAEAPDQSSCFGW